MKHIIAIIPDKLDGTSFYRGAGPLGNLAKRHGLSLSITYPDQINWSVMYQADVVYMQRPFIEQHADVARRAKLQGIPLWVDYDDDLFNVGTDNPTHSVYSRPAVQQNVAEICTNADVITVSTEHLKSKLERFNKNVIVVNNAIDFSLLHYRKSNEEMMQRNSIVMWRGSNTHTKDMLSVANQIIQTHDENLDIIFEFMGDRQFLISEHFKPNQFIHTSWTDPVTMYRHMISKRPKAFIVPLMFSDFNRSKSNIAYLEAVISGAIPIVPNILEFNQPGALPYETQDEFYASLREAISMNETDHLYFANLGLNNVKENYNLDTVNLKRKEILLSL